MLLKRRSGIIARRRSFPPPALPATIAGRGKRAPAMKRRSELERMRRRSARLALYLSLAAAGVVTYALAA